jgi:hypothetical protein
VCLYGLWENWEEIKIYKNTAGILEKEMNHVIHLPFAL